MGNGARVQEARRIVVHHVQLINNRTVIPPSENKGGHYRVIYLTVTVARSSNGFASAAKGFSFATGTASCGRATPFAVASENSPFRAGAAPSCVIHFANDFLQAALIASPWLHFSVTAI